MGQPVSWKSSRRLVNKGKLLTLNFDDLNHVMPSSMMLPNWVLPDGRASGTKFADKYISRDGELKMKIMQR